MSELQWAPFPLLLGKGKRWDIGKGHTNAQ